MFLNIQTNVAVVTYLNTSSWPVVCVLLFTELGEEIQYEIDELAFTADEKHVIYSNIYTNDIVFLDYKLKKKVKCIKGIHCRDNTCT